MEKRLVSIVIPVYNVEKYIDRCLNSIVGQTYKNIEIILIDDGSTDSCPDICDRWEKEDSRIKVLHKPNEGLGRARNSGIGLASGDLICFVDSDDYIAKDTVETLTAAEEKNSCDVLIYGMNTVRNGTVMPKPVTARQELFVGSDITGLLLPDLLKAKNEGAYVSGAGLSACTCMTAASLIKQHEWRFVSERDIISEDYYSVIQLLTYAESVCIVPTGLYYYTDNEGSLTHRFKADRVEKLKVFYKETGKLFAGLENEYELKRRLASTYFDNYIGALKQLLKFNAGNDLFVKSVADDEIVSIIEMVDEGTENRSRRIFRNAILRRDVFACRCLLKAQLMKDKYSA